MNKKIKRIIATTLAITAFSAVSPAKYLKFIDSSIAYASSNEDDDKEEAIKNSYLHDLDISEGDINFSKEKTDYTVKVDKNTESIKITAIANDKDDEIKIDGEDISLDSNNKVEKTVKLDKGRNLIKIKVVTEDYGLRVYNLVVNRGSVSNTSSTSNDNVYLDNIELSDGSLTFSKNKISYDVNVNSSIDELRIEAQPEDDEYEVKIDGIKVDRDEKYRRTVNLINGNNKILIDIEDNEGDEKIYTLNIYRGGTNETNNSEVIDNTQDPIYLDDIVIEDGSVPLKFKPKVTSYAVDVKEDWDNILIKAKAQYDDMVRIDDSKFEGTNREKVNLKKGKNVIEIYVDNSNTYDKSDDEYEKRVYTLTVYRGTSEGTSKSESQNAAGKTSIDQNIVVSTSSDIKANQWINNNGKWQYNDSTGNSIKSNWYFDKNYGKNYYFKEDGSMATGWVAYSGNWYYLDNSGAMITGWKQVGSNWYYLYENGVMAKDTSINRYKIGSNGAWIN